MVIILQKINWKLYQKIDSNGLFSPRKSRSLVSTDLFMYILKICIVCYSSVLYNYTTLFLGDFMSRVMEAICWDNLSWTLQMSRPHLSALNAKRKNRNKLNKSANNISAAKNILIYLYYMRFPPVKCFNSFTTLVSET